MGKEVRGQAEAAALSPDAERSIGAYLARQRELRGISLDELAALTRIPRRSLERLESGVFDRAPDGFVRGFVRTVAGALGLDADEAVMRLLREPSDEQERAAGERALRRARGLRIGLAAAVVLVALVGLVRLVATPHRAPSDSSGSPEAAAGEVVVRRDPVRALAKEAASRPRPPPPPVAEAAPEPESAVPAAAVPAPAAPGPQASESAATAEPSAPPSAPVEAVAPAAPPPAPEPASP